MGNYIFYTPKDLAELLLKFVPSQRPIRSITDICCGSWNLLSAAKARYPDAKIVGVDIDETLVKGCLENAEFVHSDGREYADSQVKQNLSFDLILSNPPFGALKEDEKKYTEKGNALTESKRYEAEMLWANYQLMNSNSIMIIILPSTYVDGTAYKKYRRWIAQNCNVLDVIHLPQNTFGKSKLKTVALVLGKKQTPNTNVSTNFHQASYNNQWSISHTHTLTHTTIESGIWSTLPATSSVVDGLQIFRGNVSSKQFLDAGDEILHCSSTFYRSYWRPSIRKCTESTVTHPKYAKRGDIVINRIGRSAGYWCIYHEKKRLVSDCIIVISSPSKETIELIQKMSDNHRLNVPLRGVSTQYITMEDIVSKMSLFINDQKT